MMKIINRDLFIKIYRYSIVGIINWGVFLAIIYAGRLLHVNYIIYTGLAYIASIFVSFFLNLIYTFKVSGVVKKRLIIFLIINLVNTLIAEVIQIVLVEYFLFPIDFGIVAGIIFFTIFGFIMNYRYVYFSHEEK